MDQPQNVPPQRPSRAVVLAKEVVADLGHEERLALYRWAQELLAIRSARASRARKALAAIRATTRRDTMVALVRQMRMPIQKAGYKSKKLLWDDRNWPARLALSGVTVGLVAGGPGAGAGIAALGGAVGVPLWVLTAAGGAFLGTLVEELKPLLSKEGEIVEASVDWEELDRLLTDDGEDGEDSEDGFAGVLEPPTP